LDGQIWALKADSLTSPLIVTVTVRPFARLPWSATLSILLELWKFRSHILSLAGAKSESFIGVFVPWYFRSLEFSLLGTFVPGTFVFETFATESENVSLPMVKVLMLRPDTDSASSLLNCTVLIHYTS